MRGGWRVKMRMNKQLFYEIPMRDVSRKKAGSSRDNVASGYGEFRTRTITEWRGWTVKQMKTRCRRREVAR